MLRNYKRVTPALQKIVRTDRFDGAEKRKKNEICKSRYDTQMNTRLYPRRLLEDVATPPV